MAWCPAGDTRRPDFLLAGAAGETALPLGFSVNAGLRKRDADL